MPFLVRDNLAMGGGGEGGRIYDDHFMEVKIEDKSLYQAAEIF